MRIETFEWLLSIGKALDYLHDNDVLHRDVKPANILFNKSGDAYLADFGVAKNPTEVTNFTQHATATGTSPGTFGYMAPEVLNPEPNMPIAGSVDQYALAVTLHEAIAGKRPYNSTNMVKLYLLTQQGCPPLQDSFPHLPAGASDAVARALSNDPAERFDSCRSFADAFLDGLRNSSKKLDETPIPVAEAVDGTREFDREQYRQELENHARSKEGANNEKMFASPTSKKSLPHKLVKTRSSNDSSKGLLIGVGSLLLLGLLFGGLYFSGMFSSFDPFNRSSNTSVRNEKDDVDRSPDDGPAADSPEQGEPDKKQSVEPKILADSTTTSPVDPKAKTSPTEPVTPVSFELAQNLFSSTGEKEEDQASAISMFKKLANKGSLKSQKRLAEIYTDGDLGNVDHKEAFSWLLMAAKQGDAESQMTVGASYLTGQHGVRRDLEEAVLWLRKSAEKDFGPAQMMLGVYYSDGLVVKADPDRAKQWLERAVASGEVEAEQLLTDLNARSMKELTVNQYKETLLSVVKRHAEHGFGLAKIELGDRYAYGRGVTEDDKEAVQWYRKAAEQGIAEAQYKLGLRYESGKGIEKDKDDAMRWFNASADQGNKKARAGLKRLNQTANKPAGDQTRFVLKLNNDLTLKLRDIGSLASNVRDEFRDRISLIEIQYGDNGNKPAETVDANLKVADGIANITIDEVLIGRIKKSPIRIFVPTGKREFSRVSLVYEAGQGTTSDQDNTGGQTRFVLKLNNDLILKLRDIGSLASNVSTEFRNRISLIEIQQTGTQAEAVEIVKADLEIVNKIANITMDEQLISKVRKGPIQIVVPADKRKFSRVEVIYASDDGSH